MSDEVQKEEKPEGSGTPQAGGLLEWTEAMSVGNDILDDDHKTFFDLAKIILEVDADNGNTIVFQSALNMLADYVHGHFLREEKALRAVNYPHFDAHEQKHKAFRQYVMKIVQDYGEGRSDDIRNLPGLVVSWLNQHILAEDMQYKFWIKEKFVDKRPLAFLAVEAETKF
ncbi:Hemerythrin-like protein [Rhodospirillaceae bacterium LM-1]|nr:Hemerythrin-like protein [Rhodospirillaceae bacterium LM-1]